MKTNLWSSAAANGLMLSLITIVVTLFQTAFPMGTAISILIWVAKSASTIGLLYYFMKQFGSELESYSYSAAFSYGFVTSFCSNIAITCYLLLHNTIIFPETGEKIVETIVQMQQNRSVSIDQPTIDLIEKYFPLIFTAIYLFLYTIYALLFPAILASFAKKEEVPFISDSED